MQSRLSCACSRASRLRKDTYAAVRKGPRVVHRLALAQDRLHAAAAKRRDNENHSDCNKKRDAHQETAKPRRRGRSQHSRRQSRGARHDSAGNRDSALLRGALQCGSRRKDRVRKNAPRPCLFATARLRLPVKATRRGERRIAGWLIEGRDRVASASQPTQPALLASTKTPRKHLR